VLHPDKHKKTRKETIESTGNPYMRKRGSILEKWESMGGRVQYCGGRWASLFFRGGEPFLGGAGAGKGVRELKGAKKKVNINTKVNYGGKMDNKEKSLGPGEKENTGGKEEGLFGFGASGGGSSLKKV